MLLDLLILFSAGFSVIGGVALLAAYVRSSLFPKKSAYSVTTAAGLTLVLAVLQYHHAAFVLGGSNPLQHWTYLVPLFLGPAAFLLFGRAVVMPDTPFRPWLLLHAAPLLLPVLVPLTVALPMLFAIGCGYAVWLSMLVYRARDRRRQRSFETAFSVAVTVAALAVFGFGVALPWLEPVYFVAVYAVSVAVAYAMVVFALVAIPDFVGDLFEATQARYSVSKLKDVDVDRCIERLERLMNEERMYQSDDVNLASVAEAVGVTPHQLSELVNSRIGVGFSQYVRGKRLAEACGLLRSRPEQSILSIALEVGFRSQSTFYAAFKSELGQSPGEFREAE